MRKIVTWLSLCSLTVATTVSMARETVVSGGVGLGYEIYDKSAKDETVQPASDDDYARAILTPAAKVKNEGQRSSYTAEYHPTIMYDDNGDDQINQAFSLSANWVMTSRWQLSLANTYVETDTSTATVGQASGNTAATSQSQITSTAGRHQYATNQAKAEAKYMYWEDSLVKFGYILDTLRNKDDADTYQDYDKHDIFAGISHRFSSDYRMSMNADYIIGKYGDQAVQTTTEEGILPTVAGGASDDIHEEHIDTVLESLQIPHMPLSMQYTLAAYQFDSELKNNAEIHKMLLGWAWEPNRNLKIFLGAGPIYEHIQNGDDYWDYATRASLDHTGEKSTLNLSAEHGREIRNFTATADNGLTEYWLTNAQYSYKLLGNLSAFLAGGYRYDKEDNTGLVVANAAETVQGLATTKKRTTLGGGLQYSFWESYAASLQYTFVHQESETAIDEYDEHRLMLMLSYNKDFFRW